MLCGSVCSTQCAEQLWLVLAAWKENSCVLKKKKSLKILCHFYFRNLAKCLQMLNSHYLRTINTHRQEKNQNILCIKSPECHLPSWDFKKIKKINKRLFKTIRFKEFLLLLRWDLKMIYFLKRPFQHLVPAKSKTLSHKWWSRESENFSSSLSHIILSGLMD